MLTNEFLIERFEYLNLIGIFYSFDQLNYRIYCLIPNVPLSVNFQNVDKSSFSFILCSLLLSALVMGIIFDLRKLYRSFLFLFTSKLSILRINRNEEVIE